MNQPEMIRENGFTLGLGEAPRPSPLCNPGTPLSQKIGPNQGGVLEYPDGTKLELIFGRFPPRNHDFRDPK